MNFFTIVGIVWFVLAIMSIVRDMFRAYKDAADRAVNRYKEKIRSLEAALEYARKNGFIVAEADAIAKTKDNQNNERKIIGFQ